MLTLEEAIVHATEAADRLEKDCNTKECSLEHRQLAKWLKELKEYKGRETKDISNRLIHKKYKYTFHMMVSGNDKYCMSMTKNEIYTTTAAMDIDAYNSMIHYCILQGYDNFTITHMEKENI